MDLEAFVLSCAWVFSEWITFYPIACVLENRGVERMLRMTSCHETMIVLEDTKGRRRRKR